MCSCLLLWQSSICTPLNECADSFKCWESPSCLICGLSSQSITASCLGPSSVHPASTLQPPAILCYIERAHQYRVQNPLLRGQMGKWVATVPLYLVTEIFLLILYIFLHLLPLLRNECTVGFDRKTLELTHGAQLLHSPPLLMISLELHCHPL